MRNLLIPLTIIILSSCGTTGHIIFYDYYKPKYEIERELEEVINQKNTVPQKWRNHTQDDYFERHYLYFASNPEELYEVGFTCDSSVWKVSKTCRLGLISIYQGDQFKYAKDLSEDEKSRVQKRFESLILSKMKDSYTKSDDALSCSQ